ncbi:helix-turn-helix transcriptional regulator [Dysosmobacter sp.]|uniref:helix-turn-helix transcriptional regulator n=1 Tax=Dysosmobacter sp. TaxID=2591382 RepID=UPI002A8A3D23|nr:AraC family transcriptional regulator [Dysosmobacter sp.]MDY3281307.1 AraC family transcriptional regulator [Dysosmobacter sp.]
MKEQILAVQRMQDYIGEHLTGEIHLSDLSRVSLYSTWYSYRLFRETLGLTPAEYVWRLRLSRAASRLRAGGDRVIDIAMDLGFGSADTFTRAFFREFGLNPGDYAKDPVPIPLFIPYGAKYRELRKENLNMSDLQTVFVQVIRKPERLCIIKRAAASEDYFPYCEEVGCDVWGILMSMRSLCGEPVCMWLPPRYKKPGTSTYVQGVEVETDYAGAVPEGFDVIRLPEAEYLMFQGQPFREEDYCGAIRAVQQAMDGYDPAVIGYRWDDENPRIQMEPRGGRGYIELRAVRKTGA